MRLTEAERCDMAPTTQSLRSLRGPGRRPRRRLRSGDRRGGALREAADVGKGGGNAELAAGLKSGVHAGSMRTDPGSTAARPQIESKSITDRPHIDPESISNRPGVDAKWT